MKVFLALLVALTVTITSPEVAAQTADLARATALNKQGYELHQQGRYAEAEPPYERAIEIREKALGPGHPSVATILNNLAALYRDQGRYAEAEPAHKRALAIREKALGPDHPDVATSLNNLAELYRAQGRFAEAEPPYKRALAIYEKALGQDHPDLATSLNNLAELYRAQGRYAEAEPAHKRALAIKEKALGPDHPGVAVSLNNLALLYNDQGRYAEAEPPSKRALAIYEKALGPDHPSVATSLNNLAALYQNQGRYIEAEPPYKRALSISEEALGPDHPSVAASLNNLAALYQNQGRYAEAESPFKRALAIREKALGPDHPHVATSLNNLAGFYQDQGRFAEAEPLYKRALAIKEKALGPDHPDVATSLNNLAGFYQDQGRYAEAEPLCKRDLAIREKVLGPDHPSVATSLNNLAGLYMVQGIYTEAEPLNKRALTIYEKALGPDHPSVATSLNNLAALYQNQGRFAEAEPPYVRALAIKEKALGPDHPSVAASLNNLALLYQKQGRYAEAEPPYKRALAIYEKALGPDHPSVSTSLNNLAVLYQNQGRYTEAEPPYMRALAISEEALGPGHPDVASSLNNLAGLYHDQGNLRAALPASTRAVEIMEQHLHDSAGQRSGGGASESRNSQFYFLRNIALIDAAAAKDPSLHDAPERTFRVAQLAQSSSAGAAIAGMAARFASGSDILAAVVRNRQDQADRHQRLDAALVRAASKPPADRNAEEESRLRAALDQAGRHLDALDAMISKDFPTYAELSNPKPLESGAVQGLLAPDEALLVYLVSAEQTWLWALRSDKIELHRIEVGAYQLRTEVQTLRQALDPAFNPRLKPFPATRAYQLHQKILAPVTSLLAGARHIFIVPDASLESLPIGVLVTKPPKEDPDDPKDHRDVAWFAREHAITVLPSVGSLRALRLFSTTARASKPFFGIGNPTLEGQPGKVRGAQLADLFRGAVADVDAVRKLDPLPETADELRAVAKSRGAVEADLLLADRATEPQIRSAALNSYQVVHFATHGLVAGEIKGLAEPALVLTPPAQATPDDDGLLTASKVATLKLNADWVVLSACNTAAGDGTPGAGGLSGLAKAFFYAGARSLLVSHWSVPSEATVKLVTGAFDALGKEPGIGRAEALRRSQMAMLDPSGKAEFAHPLFWAPFVLAGEGGAGR